MCPLFRGKLNHLATFEDVCRQNVLATFVRQPQEWRLLAEVLDIFQGTAQNLDNTSWVESAMFLLRSHAAMLSACRLATAAQIVECHMVLRGCLEAALYGHHVVVSPESWEAWIRRHDSEDAKRRAKTAFSYRRVIRSLETTDTALHSRIAKLYETTIDLGAHPTERAITGMLHITETDNARHLAIGYTNPGGLAHLHCLRFCAAVGAATLAVWAIVFRDRMTVLGLDTRVRQLAARLSPRSG